MKIRYWFVGVIRYYEQHLNEVWTHPGRLNIDLKKPDVVLRMYECVRKRTLQSLDPRTTSPSGLAKSGWY
jgi:hypothetical protein